MDAARRDWMDICATGLCGRADVEGVSGGGCAPFAEGGRDPFWDTWSKEEVSLDCGMGCERAFTRMLSGCWCGELTASGGWLLLGSASSATAAAAMDWTLKGSFCDGRKGGAKACSVLIFC